MIKAEKKKNEAINQLHATEPRWFAVYTSFRREKLVKKMLDKKNIECYLPINRVTRRYASRNKIVDFPLISCYLFVKITKGEYVPVLETEHVMKFTKIGRDLFAIPEREINIIKRVVGEGLEVSMEQTDFRLGDDVEIISGNLTGLKGKLISVDGKNKFAVALENIGFSLTMSVDASLLNKIRTPAQAY